jgi:hypothetical protein
MRRHQEYMTALSKVLLAPQTALSVNERQI